ncbi:arachidonate 5-lipoxygenase [Desmophyllum pertusum]|uniref:Arachidonate 5-lipoxygenase n=1 Tax=Desmophyllum pertusum TaxID=174260 RepID=A0A9X0D4Y6_9CNID|nr:arachidonate 5-lipoxygenase [Desmophyllum pertusum]
MYQDLQNPPKPSTASDVGRHQFKLHEESQYDQIRRKWSQHCISLKPQNPSYLLTANSSSEEIESELVIGWAQAKIKTEQQVTCILMQKYYKSLTWSSYDLPRVFEERGVHDAEKLPGFHYRDDALRLWKIIKEYITDILKDTELQAWIRDLHDNGYPTREGENDHGFPSSVTSLEQLTYLLTMVIFTCSQCQHAAVKLLSDGCIRFPATFSQPHAKTTS